MAELKEEVKSLDELLGQATERGYVTTNEIMMAFPEAEENLAQLEDLFDYFYEQGIEVYEDEAEAKQEKAGEAPETTQPRKQPLSGGDGLSDIPSTDITSLYFHEMGQVPLLTIEEEVELAQQWQRGRQAEQRLSRDGHDEKERASLRREIEAGYIARDHGQHPSGNQCSQEIPGTGGTLPRFDSGGQPGSDEGRGQVRSQPRLQIQHLRYLVDPPGRHPGPGRSGTHHPPARPYGRVDQEAQPYGLPDGARSRATSQPRRHR
jgi:hypothetical protein